jgi:hypothetical protein
MSSSKKNDLKRDFAAGVYLSESQDPIPPPLTHCIRVYRILIHRWMGGGRGESLTKEKVIGAASLYLLLATALTIKQFLLILF